MYSCCHWRLETERIGSFWQSITTLMDTQECVTSNRHAEGERLRGGRDSERDSRIDEQRKFEIQMYLENVIQLFRINISWTVPKAPSHIHTQFSHAWPCAVSATSLTLAVSTVRMLTHPYPWKSYIDSTRNETYFVH